MKCVEINSIMGVALNVCLVYENLYIWKIKIRNILKTNYSRITVYNICYTVVHYYSALISDLYRIIIVDKDHKQALLYIAKTFHELCDTARREIFRVKYHKHYPNEMTLYEQNIEGSEYIYIWCNNV